MGCRAARECPECGSDSYVYDTRVWVNGEIIRRRRCPLCGAKFMTLEKFFKMADGREMDGKEEIG